MVKYWRISLIWGVVLTIAAMRAIAVAADAPAIPTPSIVETPVAPGKASLGESAPDAPSNVISTVVLATATPLPAPMPTPTVDTSVPTTGTTYIAVLVSETVMSAGGRAESEVFVSLVDVEQRIERFELHLQFAPEIIQVAGQGAPEIASASLDVKRVDNDRGQVVLALPRPDDQLLQSASSWVKVATITWDAQREGRSVIEIDDATQFVTVDGQVLSPDATYDGVVFVRAPGTIRGRVKLQGREDCTGISVSGSLSSARFDRSATDGSGAFVITTSQGEGFYTVLVTMPGYLSAESDRPVKTTVGSDVDIGQVTLLGGDVTGDNRIDIRDITYVAWQFNGYDAKADVNGDNHVDILDLSLVAANFGQAGPSVWYVSDHDGAQ